MKQANVQVGIWLTGTVGQSCDNLVFRAHRRSNVCRFWCFEHWVVVNNLNISLGIIRGTLKVSDCNLIGTSNARGELRCAEDEMPNSGRCAVSHED